MGSIAETVLSFAVTCHHRLGMVTLLLFIVWHAFHRWQARSTSTYRVTKEPRTQIEKARSKVKSRKDETRELWY